MHEEDQLDTGLDWYHKLANSPKVDSQMQQTPEPNKKHACLGCRAIKVKCHPGPGPDPLNPGTCSRCVRLKLECTFKPSERGKRPPKEGSLRGIGQQSPNLDSKSRLLNSPSSSSSSLPASNLPQSQYPAVDYSQHQQLGAGGGAGGSNLNQNGLNQSIAHPQQSPSLGVGINSWSDQIPTSSYPPAQLVHAHSYSGVPHSVASSGPSNHGPATSTSSLHTPALVSPVPAVSHHSPSHPPSQPAQSEPSPSMNSVGSHARSPGGRAAINPAPNALSLVEVVERHSVAHSSRPTALSYQNRPEPNYPDPIEMRMLSYVEAEMLFERFHTVLASYINLSDRKYHTVERIQKQSTVLFTALLTVSAKFFRPDLYPQLLSHAQALIARGLADTLDSIGFLQALLLLTYWKEPEDRSAWMRIGWAIRLGYHLGIHIPRQGPLPPDEMEARAILDRERTWFNLICFDQCYRLHATDSEGEGPSMLPLDPRFRISEWIVEVQAYGCLNDVQLPLCMSLGEAYILSRSFKSSPSAIQDLAPHLHSMLGLIWTKWLDPQRSSLYHLFSRKQVAKLRWFVYSAKVHVCLSGLTALTVVRSDLQIFGQLMPLVSDMLCCLEEELVGHDILDYLQDTIAVTFFGLAEGLIHLFPRVSRPNQGTIVKWMTRVYSACTKEAGNRETGCPAFIARFYRLVLRMVVPTTSASVPNTRPPSPRLIAGGNPNGGGQPVAPDLTGLNNSLGMGGVGGVEGFQLPAADDIYNILGPMEQELLSTLNGDDSAFMMDINTTTSDFPYWSSLSFAPGDLFLPFASKTGQTPNGGGYFDENGAINAVPS